MRIVNIEDADISRVRQFGGVVYYVATDGNDSSPGVSPKHPLKTIGAAIAACSVGDAISVKAGTYTETGLDIDVNAVELWAEIGTIIQPATGTGLTVSGNYCRVICENGSLLIDPVAAASTGLLVTGGFAYLQDIRVKCDSTAAIGFDVQGNGADLRLCRCSNPVTAAFKISGDTIKLEDCCTGGEVADTSIGFWVTGTADKFRLKDCASQGHANAGFQIDTGATNGVLKDCSSGGGDGRWVDVDDSAVWSDFTYDDQVFHLTDISNPTAPGIDNLFKVTGSVNIEFVYGDVEEAIDASVDNIKLTAHDGTNTTDITGVVDTASAPIGSMFIKTKDLGQAIAIMKSDQIRLNEDSSLKKGALPFIINAKAGATNYIRAEWSGADSVGEIHWHCQWVPLAEDGFVEAA